MLGRLETRCSHASGCTGPLALGKRARGKVGVGQGIVCGGMHRVGGMQLGVFPVLIRCREPTCAAIPSPYLAGRRSCRRSGAAPTCRVGSVRCREGVKGRFVWREMNVRVEKSAQGTERVLNEPIVYSNQPRRGWLNI